MSPFLSVKDLDMNNEELKKLLNEVETKYSEIIWLSRRNENDFSDPDKGPKMQRIMDENPDEIEDFIIANEAMAQWNHGFFTGMLAGMRFIQTAMKHNAETAYEMFPDIETD